MRKFLVCSLIVFVSQASVVHGAGFSQSADVKKRMKKEACREAFRFLTRGSVPAAVAGIATGIITQHTGSFEFADVALPIGLGILSYTALDALYSLQEAKNDLAISSYIGSFYKEDAASREYQKKAQKKVLKKIKRGANPNKKGLEGNTLLHLVTDIEFAKELIRAGADPRLPNNTGNNAYQHHLARVEHNKAASIIAKEAGDKSRVLLYKALAEFHQDMADFLKHYSPEYSKDTFYSRKLNLPTIPATFRGYRERFRGSPQ